MSDDFYKRILDNIQEGVYFVDPDRKITFWSEGAKRISGFNDEEVTGHFCQANILMHVNSRGEPLCGANRCPAVTAMQERREVTEEIFMRHRDGHRVPVISRCTPILDDRGEVVGAVEVFTDNSSRLEEQKRNKELASMALMDDLTEVANRRYAVTRLQGNIAALKRYGWPFGVLFVDIDHFKQVNDIHGHDAGDGVLRVVAKTLFENIRPFDLVARWGGEEFVVILANVDPEHLSPVASKLRALVEQSRFHNDGKDIVTTVSIGATMAHADDDLDSLVTRADRLMYRSKRDGRNQVTTDVELP